MAKQYLIDIGINDEPEDVVRKCNANFRLLANSAKQAQQSSIRNSMASNDQAIADLNEDLTNVEQRLSKAIADGDKALQDKIDEVEASILKHVDESDAALKRALDDANKVIDELTKRITELEKRVDDLEKA